MKYYHEVVFTTRPEDNSSPAQNRVLLHWTDEDPAPPPPRTYRRGATQGPGNKRSAKPIEVKMIIETDWKNHCLNHPQAKPIEVGMRFPSAAEACKHVGLTPGRISSEFARAKARRQKCAMAPRGVIWGFVTEEGGAQ